MNSNDHSQLRLPFDSMSEESNALTRSASTETTSSGWNAKSEPPLEFWRMRQMERSKFSKSDPLVREIVEDIYDIIDAKFDGVEYSEDLDDLLYSAVHKQLVNAGFRWE